MRRSIALLLGLAGAAVSGAIPAEDSPKPVPDHPSIPGEDTALERHAAWQRTAAAWREAAEIASGARGGFPFTDEEKTKLLKALNDIPRDLDALVRERLLTEPEAKLLRLDLPSLITKVQGFRTKGTELVLCYTPMPLPPPTAHTNLADRLPLLEKIVEGKTLKPQVMSRILQNVEQDIRLLSDPNYLATYVTPEKKQEAIRVRQSAEREVEKIRAMLKAQTGELESTRSWRTIAEAWAFASPLAKSHESTEAQRREADRRLQSAIAEARTLAGRGLLADAEAELLDREAASLRAEIYRDPPVDSKVLCYDMMFLPPAKAGLDRLTQRLPLLQRLVEARTIHPAVLAKVLPTVEADLKTLADEKELKLLPPEDRKKATASRKAAEAQLAEIRKLLERAP